MHLNQSNFRIFYAALGALFYGLIFFDATKSSLAKEFTLFLYNYIFFFGVYFYCWSESTRSFSSLYFIQDKAPDTTKKSLFAGFEFKLSDHHQQKEKSIENIQQNRRRLGFILLTVLVFLTHSWLKVALFGLTINLGFNSVLTSIILVLILTSFRFWGAHLFGLYLGITLFAAGLNNNSLLAYAISFSIILLFLTLHIALTSWYWHKMSAVSFQLNLSQIIKKLYTPLFIFLISFLLTDLLLPHKNKKNLLQIAVEKIFQNTSDIELANKILPKNLNFPKIPTTIEKLTPQIGKTQIQDLEKALEVSSEKLRKSMYDQKITHDKFKDLENAHQKLAYKLQKTKEEIERNKNVEILDQKLTNQIKQNKKIITQIQLNNNQDAAKGFEFIQNIDHHFTKQFNERNKEEFKHLLHKRINDLDLARLNFNFEELSTYPQIADLHEKLEESINNMQTHLKSTTNAEDFKLAENELKNYFQHDLELSQSVQNFIKQHEVGNEEQLNSLNEKISKNIQENKKIINSLQQSSNPDEKKRVIQNVVDQFQLAKADIKTQNFKEEVNSIDQKISPSQESILRQIKEKEMALDRSFKKIIEISDKKQSQTKEYMKLMQNHLDLQNQLALTKKGFISEGQKISNDQDLIKNNLLNELNKYTDKKDILNTEMMIKKLNKLDALQEIELNPNERELMQEIQKQISTLQDKQKKRTTAIDYYLYLKKIIIFVGVFLALYFISRLSFKKSLPEIEAIDPIIADQLKLELKQLPKGFKNFSEEVKTHYRFFHKSIAQIFFPGEEAPPPLIVPRHLKQDPNLAKAAKNMAHIFNLTIYESKESFSIKDRNIFRDSYKYFLKSLNFK